MTDSSIYVILPKADSSNSVEVGTTANETKTVYNHDGTSETKTFTRTATVAKGDKVTILKALANKNNTLQIHFNVTTAGKVTVKAGDNYPNAKCLGDLEVTLASGVNVILLEDISRFENRDGSVVLDSASGTGYAGTVYAVAKRAGLNPETENIYNVDVDY